MLVRGVFGGGAASGSSGSQVASHNRFGQYLRARTTPTNPGSSFQTAIRNSFRTLSTRWGSTLTAAQRSAWETYAANVPMENALGDAIFLTGINMYCRSNASRLQAGMTLIDAAPTTFNLGSLTAPTLTLQGGTTAGTLTFTAADDWNASASTITGLLLYAGRPQSPSINFFKGPFRLVGRVNSTAGTATVVMPFNNGPTTGKVFWFCRVSRSDGRLTSDFPASSVPG